QFTEAVGQALLLTGSLKRNITFGALLGDIPYTSNFVEGQYALENWRRVAHGWCPPFLKHPTLGTDLVWLDSDRVAGNTALRGATDSRRTVVIPDGMVRLTREAIRVQPPDILLMSVEML